VLEILEAPKAHLIADQLPPHVINTLSIVRSVVECAGRVPANRGLIVQDMLRLVQYLRLSQGRSKQEKFRVLLCNMHLELIQDVIVASGTSTGVAVDVKHIMQLCVRYNASMIILAHNHPSGSTMPSVADEVLTREIVEASRHFGITVWDHLIVTPTGFSSFRTLGKL
jgi:DNA repair protein RadC